MSINAYKTIRISDIFTFYKKTKNLIVSNLPTLQLFITIKSIFQLYSIHILQYFQ